MLGYLIKEWAKNNKILGGHFGHLTSYAWLLLTIHYLQIIKPPILPCLQKIFLTNPKPSEVLIEYPTKIKNQKISKEVTKTDFLQNHENKQIIIDIAKTDVYFEKNLDLVRQYMEKNNDKNTAKISELLIGFFKYYSNDFNVFFHNLSIKKAELYTISIKEGKLIPRIKMDKNSVFSIEDPFDIHYFPGKLLKKKSSQAKIVLAKLKKSYENSLLGLFDFNF